MRSLIILISAAALAAAAGCASPQPGMREVGAMVTVQADTLALDLGEWDQAESTLRGQLQQNPSSAPIHYYLGLALFRKATDFRENGDRSLPMGMLTGEEAAWFSEALERFRSAADLDPASTLTANALYLAGQCLDLGRLQRFKEAMELYRRCADDHPQTDAGWRCLQRYDFLKKRFGEVEGSSHGKGM